MAENDKKFEFDARVLDVLPNSSFKLQLENSPAEIIGYISGKMRMHYIKIAIGDRVKVELTSYDLKRGRITYRYNNK